ncbi:MAG: ybaK/ebsC protein [Frankiales bacterium]|nr:ybaK/ebsC protein [Frankiales bacterium]
MSAGTPATVALSRAGVDYTLHPYTHDPRATSYGDEAAAKLGVDAKRIFKTLVVAADGVLVCAVVPVAATLDLKAIAAVTGHKRCELADPVKAQRATGYVLGGISPLGHRSPMPVVVDESALGFDTIYVSAGKRGLQLELAPNSLATLAAARFAPIANR